MMTTHELHFRLEAQQELYCLQWSPDTIRGNIVLTHGWNQHAGQYHELAEYLTKNQWQVWGWDLYGHGHSSGSRGSIQNFQNYMSHLDIIIKHIQSQKTARPLVLFGHSLGALITFLWMLEKQDSQIDAICLSAPLFQLKYQPSSLKTVTAKLAQILSQEIILRNSIDLNLLTTDTQQQEAKRKDGFLHGKASSEMFSGMLKAFEVVEQKATSINHPLFIQASYEDKIADPEQISKIYKKLGGSNKNIKYYESAHEVYHDTCKKIAYKDLLSFINVFAEKNEITSL